MLPSMTKCTSMYNVPWTEKGWEHLYVQQSSILYHSGWYSSICDGLSSTQDPISDNYVSCLDGQWHPRCFVCADPSCRRPFSGGNFFEHDRRPYCEEHYHALRGSLCAGCGKPISGRWVKRKFASCGLNKHCTTTSSRTLFFFFGLPFQVHHGHVQEVSPRALRLLLLPEAAEQGHLQGAGGQALLPRVPRQALQMRSNGE